MTATVTHLTPRPAPRATHGEHNTAESLPRYALDHANIAAAAAEAGFRTKVADYLADTLFCAQTAAELIATGMGSGKPRKLVQPAQDANDEAQRIARAARAALDDAIARVHPSMPEDLRALAATRLLDTAVRAVEIPNVEV